jgi:hypothetical protein
MNAAAKIALPPLDFDEFNTLDVLVNGEIAEVAFRARLETGPRARDINARLLEQLRKLRTRIDAARPSDYAAAIRAARAESVCDT